MDELKRQLLSLTTPKCKVLLKSRKVRDHVHSSSASGWHLRSGTQLVSWRLAFSCPVVVMVPLLDFLPVQTKDVEDDDVFRVNTEFSSKLIKIKVKLEAWCCVASTSSVV